MVVPVTVLVTVAVPPFVQNGETPYEIVPVASCSIETVVVVKLLQVPFVVTNVTVYVPILLVDGVMAPVVPLIVKPDGVAV